MGLEDDFLLEDADDEKTVEFIKNYLPQELKEKFEDDELYYFLDLIDEYYSESGILTGVLSVCHIVKRKQFLFKGFAANVLGRKYRKAKT